MWHLRRRLRRGLGLAFIAGLTACGSGGPGDGAAPADELALKAESALPPGQSGFFSTIGEVRGLLSGNPADYGDHVDDQRLLYWSFEAKPGGLGTKPGTAVTPKDGVEIFRDSYGVPIVYAATVHDLWYGVGYAVAEDRLFLMDAVRRMGAGTFGELVGCGGVPGDVQQRTLAYSDTEYQQFFERLSPDSQDSILGYVDGANAWRAQAVADPTKLPAEYVLLTTTPAEFTVKDVLAAGVFITRFVAAEGGKEFQNIAMIQALEGAYGSRAEALKAFEDMTWLEDPKAVTTIPRDEGTFSNQAEPAAGREAVFRQMADWALTLPVSLAKGPGTGGSAPPPPCSSSGGSSAGTGGGSGTGGFAVRRGVVTALEELRASLHGGSHAFAIGPSRTHDRGTLLLSGPQLGYSYPLLLVEYEIHGAGYDARGSSVPILPVVGIGYSQDVAWGLTTGYSKTIDSFVETICSTAQQQAGTCKPNQYFHQNQWKDMSCRTEAFNYRAATQGLPLGPPILSTTAEICRTAHGPIVARDEAAGLARSVQYAMFLHEIDTIEGVREWNRAHSFAEFVEAVKKVTWNENVTVAARDGHIGYFHPGLFPRRSPDTDMRLPAPGTGEFDLGPNLSFDELPHAVDPAQGFLANWNNKPAFGWLDGEGLGDTSRPAGPGQRVTSIGDFLATRSDWGFSDLKTIDAHDGTTDPRAREYLPVIRAFRDSAGGSLNDVDRAALDRMLGWDHSHYGPGIDLNDPNARDGAPATIFGEYVTALRDELFGTLKSAVIEAGGATVYGRLTGTGSHVFDQSVMDNLVIRVLDPSSSGLTLRRDYTGGRSRDQVMSAALATALVRLAAQFNGGAPLTPSDLDKCLRIHPRSQLCSLTGVIGPGSNTLPGTSCVTMPYQDRGSWLHRVGYERTD